MVIRAQNPAMYVKIGLMDTEKEKKPVRPAQIGQKITEEATPANYVKALRPLVQAVTDYNKIGRIG
jgi:hypothetical protein